MQFVRVLHVHAERGAQPLFFKGEVIRMGTPRWAIPEKKSTAKEVVTSVLVLILMFAVAYLMMFL